MSRSQTTGAADTAKDRSGTFYTDSQNSYANAQADVGNYEKSLGDYAAKVAKFQSSNPYVKGGQFDTASNQQTANTADAMARSAGEALQGQSLRTGENSAGAIGATEKMQEQNTRDLSADQAKLNQQRIGGEAAYNEKGVGMQGDVTKATEFPVAAETALSGQQGNLSEEELKNAMQAYESAPSFGDQFGGAFAKGLGSASAKFLMG
jgi:hypothetical protein